MTSAAEVIRFWTEAGPQAWFKVDPDFDDRFRCRFEAAHFAASRREYEDWMQTPHGALALVILLDQFPRNCFRGSAHAYATDGLALHYAERALEAGFDARIDQGVRFFLYLPFEHSEDPAHQERSVALMGEDPELGRWARGHRDDIRRFGRFPHRNRELGRITTPEEQEYLDAGGGYGTA
jgi:uncharacterized protein (DUF924 family)